MRLKKAVLIIHGFAGGVFDQEYLSNYLQLDNKLDIYTFTLPGHSKNIIKGVKNKDWIKKSEKQIEFLIDNNYSSIYVIGHSMGGLLACHLAVKYKQVKKLVLAAPAFRYLTFEGDDFKLMKSLKSSSDILKDYGTDTILQKLLKLPITTIKEFTSLVKISQELPSKINIPVLIVHGDNDRIVPYSSSVKLKNNFLSKKVVLVKLKSVTHDIFRSKKTKDTSIIIRKFLNSRFIKEKTMEI